MSFLESLLLFDETVSTHKSKLGVTKDCLFLIHKEVAIKDNSQQFCKQKGRMQILHVN